MAAKKKKLEQREKTKIHRESMNDKLILKSDDEIKELDTSNKEKFTLEVVEKNKRRQLEFVSEEDKKGWEKANRKRKLYMPYYALGFGINILLYNLGLRPNIVWGMVIGVGIPMGFMVLFAELHYRYFMGRRANNS